MEAQHTHGPDRTYSDRKTYLVPIILGIGTAALFALPTVSFTSSDGDRVQVGLSDVRRVMTELGYDWVVFVSAVGVLAALAAALFLPPHGPQPRNLIMGVGAVAALAFPFAFFFTSDVSAAILFVIWFPPGDALPLADKLELAGIGMIVYTAACLAAAVWVFALAIMAPPDSSDRSRFFDIVAETSGRVIPLVLGLGIAAFLFLPVFSGSNGWSLREWYIRGDYSWMTIVALVGLTATIVAAIAWPVRTSSWRRPVMVAGSITGLLVPLALLSAYYGEIFVGWDDLDVRRRVAGYFFERAGPGFFLYPLACIVAAALGFLSRPAPVDSEPFPSHSASAPMDLAAAPSWMKKQQ